MAPSNIQLLALDVDGVMTDGSIYLDAEGTEIKRFCAKDGVALRTWQRLGMRTAVVTGRTSPAVLHRAADLGIQSVIQGSKDKAAAIGELVTRLGIPAERIAFLGDDWPDLPALRAVGYPMAVINAAPQVKEASRWVTTRRGGDGAVREAVEHLLGAMNMMERALALYDGNHAVR